MLGELKTATTFIEFKDITYEITGLIDLNEVPLLMENFHCFLDETSWPIFGKVWPSAIILTEYLLGRELTKGRILEIGCGLGFPSMILNKKGQDITASDGNPYAERFLKFNSSQNHLEMPKFLIVDWTQTKTQIKYDLIVGSDIIYERTHPAELAAFLSENLALCGKVILCDPNRSLFQKLKIAMKGKGFSCVQEEILNTLGVGKTFKILTFIRA
ncbi:MAG: methyltransferase domain-containing protein [Pseudomonadota bacterium]